MNTYISDSTDAGGAWRSPSLHILNNIHRQMGEVVRSGMASKWPHYVFMGRSELMELQACGLELFSLDRYPANMVDKEEVRYVMGLEIVPVDRNEFLMVV